ncbi:hypothetical protein EDB81DRAFT_227858 [Dactylonectria macrodidyma]|uniref:Uncharacterized protein n=1 Tax=Dactylonectria macrodidyma TaxID=307937 RepID=A0A9P9DMN5_9HYPO|nr:hypothetical protein EDB81DRAFT_227858 [Dactylonectria macrodidyma]
MEGLTQNSLERDESPSPLSSTIMRNIQRGAFMPLPLHFPSILVVLSGSFFPESIHLQLCPLHRHCPHIASPPIQQPQPQPQQPPERVPSTFQALLSSLLFSSFPLLLPPLPFCGTGSVPPGSHLRLGAQGAVVPRKPEQHPPLAIDQSLLQPTTLAHASTDLAARRHTGFPSLSHSAARRGKWLLWSKPASQRVSKLNNTSASRGISFAGCRRILKSLRAM